jgi:putative ABC transport system permease protein
LIEFQLTDLSKLGVTSFGVSINQLQDNSRRDCNLLRLPMRSLDGIVAAPHYLVSILINIVASLPGFTILSTIEEDYREIGVMKRWHSAT